jgi:hypothetical protein
MKIIVDGEFDISDETGQTVHAVKGDVFYCKYIMVGIKTIAWMLIWMQSLREARSLSKRTLLAWDSLLVNERYVSPYDYTGDSIY